MGSELDSTFGCYGFDDFGYGPPELLRCLRVFLPPQQFVGLFEVLSIESEILGLPAGDCQDWSLERACGALFSIGLNVAPRALF